MRWFPSRKVIRWPALLGALAAGLSLAVIADLGVRRFCPPLSTFMNYRPGASNAVPVRVEAWHRPLGGFGARTWAWSDLDLTDAGFGAGGGGGGFGLLLGEDGPVPQPTPIETLIVLYGTASLSELEPLPAFLGARVRVRATRFGFPFRSSVREVVSGVNQRTPPAAEGIGVTRPGLLALSVASDWPPSANSSDANLRRAGAGATAQREWVLPLGVLANTLVFACLILSFLRVPLAIRNLLRSRRGCCIACGYPSRGLGVATCPECGNALPNPSSAAASGSQ